MKLNVILLFQICSSIISGSLGIQQCPPTPPATKPIQRLRETLFCDYSKDDRPVKDSKTITNVSLHFYFTDFSPLEDSNAATVSGMFHYDWLDEYLKWDPKSYNDIRHIQAEGEHWTPELITNAFSTSFTFLTPSNCILESTGVISCLPNVLFKVPCTTNTRHWPYEVYNCTMQLLLWTSTDNEVNITFFRAYPNLKKVKAWKMLDISWKRRAQHLFEISSNTIITANIVMQRVHSTLAALSVTPSIVLMVITLFTFWMGPRLTARVTVNGLVAFICSCQGIFLQYDIPINSHDAPVLLTLYRDDLVLAAMGIVVAITVCVLPSSAIPPPQWLSDIGYNIESSIVSKLLCIASSAANKGDEEQANKETKQKSRSWSTFTVLLDRLAFVICLIVDFILLTRYIP